MLNFSWPKARQWGQLLRVFTKKERIIFFALLVLFLGNLTFLSVRFYFKNTEIRPAKGGIFTEGLLGQPQFINPVYLSSNDADRDLVELLFSGLTKYDENGALVFDLAKDIKTEDSGRAYRVFLKENVFWSDGSKNSPRLLTADDVLFTIKTIQNQKDVPINLKANWTGVEVEKAGNLEIIFKLKNPYGAFLENLTLKIIPQHIWQNIQNLTLSDYILKPVGSGPYKFDSLQKDGSGRINSLTLKINQSYHGEKPHLQEIRFKFFKTEKELREAAKAQSINGVALSGNSINNSSFLPYEFSLPRYFAVFFNPDKLKILSELKIRQALNYGTNKQELVKEALNSQAEIIDSPILPEIFGFEGPEKVYEYDLETAKSLLEAAGFKENENGVRERIVKKEPAFQFKSNLQSGSTGVEVRELQKCLSAVPGVYPLGEVTGIFGDKTKAAVILFQEKYADEILKPGGLSRGTGTVLSFTRKKLNELCAQPAEEKTHLTISLVTISQSTMIKVADILKNQWKLMGVNLEIETVDDGLILERDYIKPRNYQTLLFGEALQSIPDPFPFWDSIQTKDPGLNLAIYENKEADKLLEEARQISDMAQRKEKLEKFQNILIKDAPSVFLYSDDYVYFVSAQVKNVKEKMIVDPSKRFSSIEKWYINTKRSWK